MNLRIIQDTPRTAAFNMAADLYLLSACSAVPRMYVRFYTWAAPTITLGFMQKSEECLNLETINREGISWIRRPTGGRAVLHHEDITYSCVFSKNITEMGQDIAETYHTISQCLINGLNHCGIDCSPHHFSIDANEIKREIKLPCFLAPNRSEVMVQGKKLIGSAQKRTDGAVLQHGSIPVTGKFRNLSLYQNVSEEQQTVFRKLLKQKCTCIEECLPNYRVKEIIGNLKQGFIDGLPFECEENGWSDEEETEIQEFADSVAFKNNWMK